MNTDITVILTAYRRLHLLKEQMQYIRAQTIQPKEIWVWRNYDDKCDVGTNIDTFDADIIFDCTKNFKFFGRFAAAWLARTKYIALFDDDTFPGTQWLENCLKTYKTHPGILGGVGIILNDSNNYMNYQRVGWPSKNKDTVEVDLVGHAWFFEQQMLKCFWNEEPFSWETGEDMFFSYAAQKFCNVKTYCPPHPSNQPTMSSSLYPNLGVDNTTESVINHKDFFRKRTDCLQEGLRRDWQTINVLKI